MRRNQPIYLLTMTSSVNDLGDAVTSPTQRKRILAEVTDVRQSEFYQSASTQYRPEIVFKVWPHQYHDETAIKYKDNLYKVIRTYTKDFRTLEIVCERERANGSTEIDNED